MKTLITAATLLMLTSCAGSSPEVGSGPISLSPGVQQSFDEYRSLNNPSVFAVSTDGEYAGYTYCPDHRCRKVGTAARAIHLCEQSGRDCKIYARRDEVVWQP